MDMEFEFIQVDSDGIIGIFNYSLSLRILLKSQGLLSEAEKVKKSDGSGPSGIALYAISYGQIQRSTPKP